MCVCARVGEGGGGGGGWCGKGGCVCFVIQVPTDGPNIGPLPITPLPPFSICFFGGGGARF